MSFHSIALAFSTKHYFSGPLYAPEFVVVQHRWVKSFTRPARGTEPARTYYYFKRQNCPTIRLPGEPGSPEFESSYNEAVAATAAGKEEIREVRVRAGMRPSPRSRQQMSPLTQALWNWATKKPITQDEAEALAQLFRVPLEMITRDRTILPSTKNSGCVQK
jgi:hypothetical protein